MLMAFTVEVLTVAYRDAGKGLHMFKRSQDIHPIAQPLISDSVALSNILPKAAGPSTQDQCVAWCACLLRNLCCKRVILLGD